MSTLAVPKSTFASRVRGQSDSPRSGDEGAAPSDLSVAAIVKDVRADGPSGFDPESYVRDLTCPSLWLSGGRDRSQPTRLDVERLAGLRSACQDVRTTIYPEADHGLLDVPPTDPRALPTLV